jgi:dTDP-glucose 4,6-dehydratase
MKLTNPLAPDLEYILENTRGLWDELRGRQLFITGGTGFFGCWLLESFLWANRELDLGASMTVLTRDPAGFRRRIPHLALDPAVTLHQGDVRSFDYPTGAFSHVIHAATAASAALNGDDPLSMLDTIVEGTRRVLNLSAERGVRKLLLTSSGAVYGKQPAGLSHIPETYAGVPDTMDPNAAYAEGKRVAELLCAIYARKHGIEVKIARGFAFVGPWLPLDRHFAAGNFIRDRLSGGPIQVKGDGTTLRSYLYAADLAIWLWTILFKGQSCRPYNVGSDSAVAISDLAAMVAGLEPRTEVRIASAPRPGVVPERYVPDIARARTELNLTPSVPLADAILRTAAWAAEKSPGMTCAGGVPQ